MKIEWQHLIGKPLDELCAMAGAKSPVSVVNMLRHQYTDYDDIIRYLPTSQVDELHVDVLNLIAQDFPELSAVCGHLLVKHKRRNRPMHVQARQATQQDAQAKLARSREVIKSMNVGDRVLVQWHGEREAVITHVARAKVTVRFEARGDVREKAYQAIDVRPLVKYPEGTQNT
ncbi:hypothetical protein MYP14_04780 [Rhodococcus pyridinivorans]|uniref:hypothetical protein n=1 Tax=Rhodococcus pyridinivorans TaxID=103816 RepID=UPI0020003ECC|nr:hypothetical protein [Rhodococcus pyridinivorans]UPK64681.1 hypothetical protein MYP14_04780 [Rhodococcus pyridinivorans]